MQKISRLIYFPLTIALCFVIGLSVAVPVSASANPVSINDLVDNSSEYDKQTITITGEAIGECLERQDGSWVNISDGTNAVGIWMTKADADLIKVYGDYKHTGDTVTVTGIFYKSCREHGGEPDIHCVSLILENAGAGRSESISVEKILSAVGIVSAALILFIIYTTKNRNISH